MKKKRRMALLLAVLLCAALACSLMDILIGPQTQPKPEPKETLSELAVARTEAALLQQREEEQAEEDTVAQEEQVPQPEPSETPLPTFTPQPTFTPRPTYTPTPANPGLITDLDYHTDFTIHQGWSDFRINDSSISHPSYTVNFENGRARINVDTSYTYVYLVQEDLWYRDGERVYVEVTIQTNEGAFNNNLGVVCRYSDNGWYEFLVRANGYWDFYTFDQENGYKQLDMGGSMNINMQHKENTVGLLCDRDTFTLYINGHKTKTIRDTTFNSGGVGINVGTLEWGEVQFDVKSFTAVNDLSLVSLSD